MHAVLGEDRANCKPKTMKRERRAMPKATKRNTSERTTGAKGIAQTHKTNAIDNRKIIQT